MEGKRRIMVAPRKPTRQDNLNPNNNTARRKNILIITTKSFDCQIRGKNYTTLLNEWNGESPKEFIKKLAKMAEEIICIKKTSYFSIDIFLCYTWTMHTQVSSRERKEMFICAFFLLQFRISLVSSLVLSELNRGNSFAKAKLVRISNNVKNVKYTALTARNKRSISFFSH